MKCSICETEFSGLVCPECSSNSPVSAASNNPYAQDPVDAVSGLTPQPVQSEFEGDSTGGVIPYKNPKALLAYYLGILSGIPFIGLPFGIAAFVLGIQGLKARKQNPVIRGSLHAGIGIGCGLIFTLLWSGLIVVLIIVLMAKA